MPESSSSSPFTQANEPTFGPPLIGALLRAPWEAVQSHMLRRLHENGCADFDAAYLPVFGYPGPQGARPSELAARLGMSKQALNYLLGSLERAGLLERAPSADDRRRQTLELGPRGRTVLRSARALLRTRLADVLGDVPPHEADALVDLLETLEARLAGTPPPRRPRGPKPPPRGRKHR
jgi:DNA-binding MarR family transcriptional regulator